LFCTGWCNDVGESQDIAEGWGFQVPGLAPFGLVRSRSLGEKIGEDMYKIFSRLHAIVNKIIEIYKEDGKDKRSYWTFDPDNCLNVLN
jgi:hypothetical protein